MRMRGLSISLYCAINGHPETPSARLRTRLGDGIIATINGQPSPGECADLVVQPAWQQFCYMVVGRVGNNITVQGVHIPAHNRFGSENVDERQRRRKGTDPGPPEAAGPQPPLQIQMGCWEKLLG